MDRYLDMRAQIRKVCRSCSNSLRNIGRIRKFISNTDAKRLSEAFILSSLDYGNILLSGLPDRELKKLQSVKRDLILENLTDSQLKTKSSTKFLS